MAHIKLKNLRKEFGSVIAVKDLGLDIKDGEFMAFLGPSGCGKTTTLNMIAGLEMPTLGEIFFDGQLMNDVPPEKRGVGFVFQDYAIFTHMSVYDNLAFGSKIKKYSKEKIRKEVQQIAKLLQLEDLLYLSARQLSLNDMQKVALGRSLIMKPKLSLLDEPLSNLDAAFRLRMRGELKRLHWEVGQTTIYVTHDQVEAMSMADRIAVMDFGVLQQYGTPNEIYRKPINKFVANFVGSPKMNFVNCWFRVEGEKAFLQSDDFINSKLDVASFKSEIEKKSTSDKLILGVRPEHIHLLDHPDENSLPAKISIFEPLGSKTIVHLQTDKSIIQAVARPDYRPTIGDKKWISFDRDNIHIFDAKTEIAII